VALVLSLLKRFRRDERGAFIVMFGIMAVVLTAMAGAVVDFTHLSEARNRAQIAMDAAALALQPRIFDSTSDTIRAAAENLMRERMGNSASRSWISNVEIDVEEGTLQLRGGIDVEMAFVRLIGFNNIEASVMSEATRRKLALEVALVLDNSGSMLQESRMDHLKSAAACATRTLFYDEVDSNCMPVSGAGLVEDVRISVIPFTMYVNVGPQNAGASWIDQQGRSSIAHHNFNDGSPNFSGPVNRLALYDQINNDSWRGCVEARPHLSTPGPDGSVGSNSYLDTDDTVPDTNFPDTLFVPLFAPDLSESSYNLGTYNNYTNDRPASCDRPSASNVSCTWTETRRRCSSYGSCSGTTTNQYGFTGAANTMVDGQYVGAYPPSCECRGGWTTDSGTNTFSGSGSNRTYTRVRTCRNTYTPTGLSALEYQERLCKYNGNINFTTQQKGPNADCPYVPLRPLSNDPSSVLQTINAMVADGGTNIHEGSAWGLRTLSPLVPLDEGSAYDEATSKVLIIMTDGENTSYQTNNLNRSFYFSAYGFPTNNPSPNYRLGAANWSNADLMNEMDARTLQTCNNAKDRGMLVYTIGLAANQTARPQQVRQMLSRCATGPDFVFFPERPTELNDVFQSIAQQLAALRLSQ
jgi:Flp pilus assembly protein TadG